MKEGRHNKKRQLAKKKKTLKEITKYITGDNDESLFFEANYQEIKRIRELLRDSLSMVDFYNIKEEYDFIRQMVEFVYQNKELRGALINVKNKRECKDIEIDIKDYYLIVEALDNANIDKKYVEENKEFNNIYKLMKSIIAIRNQYDNIFNNIIELFQYDKEKSINYTYLYRDRILASTDELNRQIFKDLMNLSKEKRDLKEDKVKTIKINIGDSIEEYEYDDDVYIEIDCKGKYIEDVDLSMYRDLKNISYINLRDKLR